MKTAKRERDYEIHQRTCLGILSLGGKIVFFCFRGNAEMNGTPTRKCCSRVLVGVWIFIIRWMYIVCFGLVWNLRVNVSFLRDYVELQLNCSRDLGFWAVLCRLLLFSVDVDLYSLLFSKSNIKNFCRLKNAIYGRVFWFKCYHQMWIIRDVWRAFHVLHSLMCKTRALFHLTQRQTQCP